MIWDVCFNHFLPKKDENVTKTLGTNITKTQNTLTFSCPDSHAQTLQTKSSLYVGKLSRERRSPSELSRLKWVFIGEKGWPLCWAISMHKCSDSLALTKLTWRVTLLMEPTFCFGCKQFSNFCKVIGNVGLPRVQYSSGRYVLLLGTSILHNKCGLKLQKEAGIYLWFIIHWWVWVSVEIISYAFTVEEEVCTTKEIPNKW